MTLSETMSTDGELLFLFITSVMGKEGRRGAGGHALWLTRSEYQPRPGYGKAGKVIKVEANMFQARFKKQGAIIQYVMTLVLPLRQRLPIQPGSLRNRVMWAVG